MAMIKPIRIAYLKIMKKVFLVPELIFFGSGLYTANILSNNDLQNAPIIVVIIAKAIVIIEFISISNNFSEIIKYFIKWAITYLFTIIYNQPPILQKGY